MEKPKKPLGLILPVLLSFTILGVFWAYKIEKVRKWILVIGISVGIDAINWYQESFIGLNFETLGGSAYLTIPYYVLLLISTVIPMYFMHKWINNYNYDNFGFESKGDWNRAQKKVSSDDDELK